MVFGSQWLLKKRTHRSHYTFTPMKVLKMGVEPKIGGFYTPKWMVKIMVPNPMNKMDDLFFFSPYFWFNAHMNSHWTTHVSHVFFWTNLSSNHPLDLCFFLPSRCHWLQIRIDFRPRVKNFSIPSSKATHITNPPTRVGVHSRCIM